MDGIDAIERSKIGGGGQSVVRRLRRHNAIEAWETMQKSGGWKSIPAQVVNMEWTDEFITNAQQELTAMVKDWQYDYGADDKTYVAMLSWMILKLKPDAEIDPGSF